MSSPEKRVLLWVPPRSLSTAFTFSIKTLPNVHVLYEPFSGPFYTTNPIEEATLKEKHSYEDAIIKLLRDYPGKEAVFAKSIALYVRDRFDMLLDDAFKSFNHSFLIRHPVKSIYSFYKAEPHSFKSYYYHGGLGVGFKEVYDLYCFLRDNLNSSSLIIDADDLLAHPESMMKAYCNAVGLKYKEGMTKWDPDSMNIQELADQFKFSSEWYSSALKSNGIYQTQPVMPVLPEGLPEEVHKAIEDSLVPYNKMYSLRLQI